eukprot:3035391-Prymnesium_polylepis.2
MRTLSPELTAVSAGGFPASGIGVIGLTSVARLFLPWGRLSWRRGGVSTSVRLHAKSLGAHTSAPLLVRFQDKEAGVITQCVSCLDF